MSKSKDPVTFKTFVATPSKCSTCGYARTYLALVPWEDMHWQQCPHCGTNLTRIPTKRVGTFSMKGSNK